MTLRVSQMSRDSRKRRGAAMRRAWLALGLLVLLGGADSPAGSTGAIVEMLARQAGQIGRQSLGEFQAWYHRTPPMERATWGGLAACVLLGLGTTLERAWRLRAKRVIPPAFVERFQKRLAAGQLDKGKGLDYCELNPSPAASVALAAIQRWGRPAADLERGVTLAKQREVDQLRRHVGTMRRIAVLLPLIGLLGTLTAAARALAVLAPTAAWGPTVATALGPLTLGVALAIVALVLYDGLTGKVEALAIELDRVGAEAVDAIAQHAIAPVMMMPVEPSSGDPRSSAFTRSDAVAPMRSPHTFSSSTATTSQAVRIPVRGQ